MGRKIPLSSKLQSHVVVSPPQACCLQYTIYLSTLVLFFLTDYCLIHFLYFSMITTVSNSLSFSASMPDTGFVPIFVYAIFGSSRQLAIGPVALVSLLVSNVLGGIVDSSEELYTELAILLALMVGILECIMGLLRYLSFDCFSCE